MITPYFWLDQDSNFVYLHMRCPLLRAQDVEYTIEPSQFYFYCQPYFLRLSFASRLIQDAREKCHYDFETSIMKFWLPKETPGTDFQDLDMLPSLLAVPKPSSLERTKLVEELHNDETIDLTHIKFEQDENFEHSDDDLETDSTLLQLEQTIPEAPTLNVTTKYGFARLYSGYFDNFPEDLLQDILDMGNPDKMTMNNSEELAAKQVIENMAFKEDQYMFDYIDLDGTIKDLIEKEPPFPGYSIHDVTFSEKESELMLELTRKSFEGLCTQDMVLYLTLVDIVLAYCYNFRMNDGENTVESSWLISKLSASLSCLIQFETLQQVIESFLRRSLCYPLYRNFSFSQKVMKDAARILSLGGKKVLMKIFLDLKVLFDKDEHRHIFSKLFLNDYCIWISKDSLNKTFHQLGRQLDILKICKKDLDWNLEEYEKLSEETTLEDSESRELPCEAL